MDIKYLEASLQVIIVVDYDDGRMFPITEEIPKCLLPIANRPILAYQLDLLEKSGALDVYIVCPNEYASKISQFLAENSRESMKVDVVGVEEMLGSADALRAVHDRITGDFIVLGSDVISDVALGRLVNLHRLQTADITMLLSAAIAEEPEKKGAPKKIHIEEEDQEYIGLSEGQRVVLKIPAPELETNISLSKPILQRCSNFCLRSDLLDVGVYVMSKWILHFLIATSKVSSIRTDLVPYLVKRQFLSKEHLCEALPGFENRKRSNQIVESWLVSSEASKLTSSHELAELLSMSSLVGGGRGTAGEPDEGDIDPVVSAIESKDPLRCFAVVVGGDEKGGLTRDLCQRITTLQTYLTINRDVPVHLEGGGPWGAVTGYRKKELSVVGDPCELGEKVTIKQCVIGNNCKVGPRSKVNQCVVMNGVQIGDSCTIQNSIICAGVTIESNCNLNECYVGAGVRVTAGSKLKSEALSGSS